MKVSDEQMAYTANKLKEIYKTGFMPKRGLTPYFLAGELANCLEHACFNLSDLQLIVNDFNLDDAEVFGDFYNGDESQLEARDRIVRFIRSTGLKVRQSSLEKPVMKNGWKVALYFNDYTYLAKKNFHMLRLEEEGIWTGKQGWGEQIKAYKEAPEMLSDDYRLFDVFDIKNPSCEM